jgi:hypothetical protein
MRHLAVFCAVMLLVGFVCAQEGNDDSQNLTKGDFAILILKVIDTKPGVDVSPVDALMEVKRLGLAPEEWLAVDILTHGDLADVLDRFGANYQPADRDEPAGRAFTEALLRRELGKLKDYLARRTGHGVSVSHVLDEGVDRAVSPIYIRYGHGP